MTMEIDTIPAMQGKTPHRAAQSALTPGQPPGGVRNLFSARIGRSVPIYGGL